MGILTKVLTLKISKLQIVFISLLVSIFLPQICMSDKSIKKVYTIGIEKQEYMPYYSPQNGGQGLAISILKDFAKQSRYQFIFCFLPVKRLYKMFLSSKNEEYKKNKLHPQDIGHKEILSLDNCDQGVDFKFPANPKWSSDLKKGFIVFYSDPVIKYTDGLMVLPIKKSISLEKIKSIAFILGFTPRPYLSYIKNQKIKPHEVRSMKSLLYMGIYNRVDGVYAEKNVTKYYLNKFFNSKSLLVWNNKLPYSYGYYRLATLRYKDVIDNFNKYLSVISKNMNYGAMPIK